MAVLTFHRATVKVFQGINKDQPLVIEFPKPKATTKKRKIGVVSGDQQVGKTSFIHFLLYATGQAFNFNIGNLVNNESKELRGELEFSHDGQPWKVKFKKNKFELFRDFRAGDEHGWIPQAQPDAMLKKLIGTVAVSPMKLKVDNGQQQVDWLFKMLNVPASILEKGNELTTQFNTVKKTRSDANKEYLHLKKSLSENPMFLSWSASEAKYKEVKTVATQKAAFEAATHKKQRLQSGKDFLVKVGKDIDTKKELIAELAAKLTAAKEELKTLENQQKVSEQFVQDNAGAVQEYDQTYQEFLTVSEYVANYELWKKVQSDKKEMDEYETVVIRCDTTKGNLLAARRELFNSVLPGIPGLEIVTTAGIDDNIVTGVYLHGKNPVQLSESELFDLYFKLCQSQGVTMAVIENISSFGSDFIKTLNAMAKSGVYIWATKMERGQKELKIEFIDEL